MRLGWWVVVGSVVGCAAGETSQDAASQIDIVAVVSDRAEDGSAAPARDARAANPSNGDVDLIVDPAVDFMLTDAGPDANATQGADADRGADDREDAGGGQDADVAQDAAKAPDADVVARDGAGPDAEGAPACGDIPSGGVDTRTRYPLPYGRTALECAYNGFEQQRPCLAGVFGEWIPDLGDAGYDTCEVRTDECLPGLRACQPRASCEQQSDVFKCKCLPNHVGDTCMPDECALQTDECSALATCVDLLLPANGLGYRCDCPAGFEPYESGPSRPGSCNRPASGERALDLWSREVAAYALANDGGMFVRLWSRDSVVGADEVGPPTIVKYASDGQKLWQKTFGDYHLTGLAPSADGGALVLTLTSNTDAYGLHRFDADGELLWQRTWPNANGGGLQLASHGDSVFIGGWGIGPLEVDGQTLVGSFVAQLDDAGRLGWTRSMAGHPWRALLVAGPSRVAWVGTVADRFWSPSGLIFGSESSYGTFALELSQGGSVRAEQYLPSSIMRAATYAGGQLIMALEITGLVATNRMEIRPAFQQESWVFDRWVDVPILAGHADGSVGIASQRCFADFEADFGVGACPVGRLSAAGKLRYVHYRPRYQSAPPPPPAAVLADSMQRDVVVTARPEPHNGYAGYRYELRFLEPPRDP